MVTKFAENTPVKHKNLGYKGRILGTTAIKSLFTGTVECEWQYIIVCEDGERRAAPESDLEILLDEEIAGSVLLLEPCDARESDSASFLMKLGYQITGKSTNERWDILVNKAVPGYGIKAVVLTIAGLMLARTGTAERLKKHSYSLQQWNHDVNCLMDQYSKDDLTLQLNLQWYKDRLRDNGYAWRIND